MRKYLGMKLGSGIESSIAAVNQDGFLEKVFIEERYNRKKYSGSYPMGGIVNLSHFISNEIELIVSEYSKEKYDICEEIFRKFSYIKTQPLLHHLCHAYESFYTSGFDRAAILVIDGFGENTRYGINEKESITLYHKIGREIKELRKYNFPNSLGNYYRIGRKNCGFRNNEEGHFMGLSAYGVPFEERFISIENGEFKYNCDLNEFEGKRLFDKKSLGIINSINFAATVQRDLNECVLELVKDIKNMTKEDNLCLSGGVFNNVITNNIVCESGIFKNVWCSPAPGDFGVSIGEAYITYEQDVEKPNFNRIDNAYKGSIVLYNDEYIVKYLNEKNIKYKAIFYDEIVDRLCKGEVLAWFQGGSEIGRRALGHRSLIANPEDIYMYKKLSEKIKGRAPYRPLACTVPDELFDLMFDIKNKDLTEYMLRAMPIKKEMRKKVRACTHIDGTTRPQRLKREVNPEFYDMIMTFYKKTGVPCVVNTSLNGGGEPMVESLEDLFDFLYYHRDVEGAVINGKFYVKNDI